MPRLGGSVARGVQYGKCKSDWRFALRLTNPARSRVGLGIFGSDPKDHKTKIGVGPGLACTPSERELRVGFQLSPNRPALGIGALAQVIPTSRNGRYRTFHVN